MFAVTLSIMLGLRARGQHPHPVRHWLGATSIQRRWLLLRTVVSVVTVGLSTASLQFLVISDANAFNFMWPVFALLISFAVLGERVRRIEIIGLAGAVAGGVLVARPAFLFSSVGAAPIDAMGVAIALSGACTMGWTVVLIRKIASQVNVHWTIAVLCQTLGQVLLFPLCMLVLGDGVVMGQGILGYSVATGALGSFHQIMLTLGLAKERVGPAAAMQSTFVLSSFFLQALATPDDALDPMALSGALTIVASVVLILATKKAPPPPLNAANHAAASERPRSQLAAGVGSSEDPIWRTEHGANRAAPPSLELAADMSLNAAAAAAACAGLSGGCELGCHTHNKQPSTDDRANDVT